MYGGRAIDDFDRRVLKTYMDEYMGDFIFDSFQPFHFYRDADVDYVIPPDGPRDSYLEAIEALPLVNTPEVFGLHSNAEIGYFTRATKDMWTQLIELQPQTGETGAGVSREDFIGGIAADIQVRDIPGDPHSLTHSHPSHPHTLTLYTQVHDAAVAPGDTHSLPPRTPSHPHTITLYMQVGA